MDERMRETLATKCMGWQRCYLVEWDTDVWMEPSGEPDGLFVVEGMYDWRDWKPDENWPQCGLVIEAMREKGFVIYLSIATIDGEPYALATCHRFDPVVAEYLSGQSQTEDRGGPLAVCEAICQALEGYR